MSQVQEEYKPAVETLENKYRTKQKSCTLLKDNNC